VEEQALEVEDSERLEAAAGMVSELLDYAVVPEPSVQQWMQYWKGLGRKIW